MIQNLNKIRSWFSAKGFPSSIQSFIEYRKSSLYVDKSELINQIIQKGQFAPLITRPRRWGKSMSLDMLQHFFQPNGWQKVIDQNFDIRNGNQYKPLFVGNEQYEPLQIAKYKNIVEQHQGQNPVVQLNFSDLKFTNQQEFNHKMKEMIFQAYSDHQYIFLQLLIDLIQDKISSSQFDMKIKQTWQEQGWIKNNKIDIKKIMDDHDNNQQIVLMLLQRRVYKETNQFQFLCPEDKLLISNFIGNLSDDHIYNFQLLIKQLYNYFDRKIVILIDEFDATTVSFISDELDQLSRNQKITNQLRKDYHYYMKNFMLRILKYPLCYVIQNCVIVAISDIFSVIDSSLNNITYCPVTSDRLLDCFAFTNIQVNQLIEKFSELMKNDYQIDFDDEIKSQLKQNIEEWYNGYNLNNQQLYCPYSVIEYLSLVYNIYPSKKELPQPGNFWTSSGTNLLLQKLGEINLSNNLLQQLEILIQTGKIKFTSNLEIKQYPDDVRKFSFDDNLLKFILINTGYITQVSGEENTFKIPNKEIHRSLMPQLFLLKMQQYLKIYGNEEVREMRVKCGQVFQKAEEFQQFLEQDVFPLMKVTHFKERTFQDLIGDFFPTLAFQIIEEQEYITAIPEYSGSNQKKIDHYFRPKSNNYPIILHEYKLAKSITQVQKLVEEAIWQIYGKCYLDVIINEQILAGENKNDRIIARVLVFYQNSSNEWKVNIVQINHTFEQAQQINNLFMKKQSLFKDKLSQVQIENVETLVEPRSKATKQKQLKFLNQQNASNIYVLLQQYGTISGMVIPEDK